MRSGRFAIRALSIALALAANGVSAVPRIVTRDDTSSNSTDGSSVAPDAVVLEPVVPPALDGDSLQVLTPSPNVTLYYQSPSAVNSRKRDTSTAAVQLAFRFKYPAVALDHSNSIDNVSCTDSTIFATFGDSTGFSQAQKTWSTTGSKKYVLITSTVGCGSNDTQNGYFITNSTVFDKSSLSVTAAGSFVSSNETFNSFSLTWGSGTPSTNSSTGNVERSLTDWTFDSPWDADFEMSPEIAKGMVSGSNFELAKSLAGQQDDDDAPWENAFLLWESGGDDDKSGDDAKTGSTGDAKRSLERRKGSGIKKGLKLYCVDCDINGHFTFGGIIEVCIDPTGWTCNIKRGVEQVGVYMNGQLHAGMYLGLEAYIKWEKEFKRELYKLPIAGFEIPDPPIIIGPYFEVDIMAKVEAMARGSILAGGALDWPAMDIWIDFLDTSNSYVSGFEPLLTEKFEAKGELSVATGIGLPFSFGVGVDILAGTLKADIAVQDTPSINANASISISYIQDNTLNFTTGNWTASEDNGLNINDDCYGINWMIYLENKKEFVAEFPGVDPWTWPIGDPWQKALAQDCLGYKKPYCSEPVRASPLVDASVTCNQPRQSIIEGHEVGGVKNLANVTTCAQACMKLKNCASFSWADDSLSCQLYDAITAEMTANWGSGLAMYDRHCWQTRDCPWAPDNTSTITISRRDSQDSWTGISNFAEALS